MKPVFSAIALCVLAAGLNRAQEETGAVFRTDTRLVVLHATVVDKNGRHVTTLPRTAFQAFEDGVEQQIRIFRREDVPVSMGLVIDNSGSMREKRSKVEAAALGLVKASNPQDEVFIVNFNDAPYQDVPFTSDLKRMQEGIARIDSSGGTAMRDAILASIGYAKSKGRHDKKVIVAITDGNDNMSEVELDRLIREAQQQEVVVYVIGLFSDKDRGEARKAKRAIDELTRATGGLAYYPEEVDQVGKVALQVAHEIRNQYIIAYSPSNPALDGSYRRIQLQVKGPNRPVARTRTGYYATAAPAASRAAERKR